MDVKKLQIIPRPIEAVQLTDSNIPEVRDWVQSQLAFQNVVGTAEKLYLPESNSITSILEPGDWVFHDTADNSFRGAEDAAVKAFYEEIEE